MPFINEDSNKLGLPLFLSVVQKNQPINKGSLKATLQQFLVSPMIIKNLDELADIDGWSTFPAIIKLIDSQGVRGEFFAEYIERIHHHLEEALHFSRSKFAIIEDYLDGLETTALVLVERGKIILRIISDRLTVEEYHTGIRKGYRTPSHSSSSDDIEKTNILTSQVIKLLDIKSGPLYFRLKLTSNGPKILEIGHRLDGGHIWQLIKLYCGVDIFEITSPLLMNEDLPSIDPQPKFRYGQLDFSLQPPGEEFDSDRVELPKEILTYQPYFNKGVIVSPTIDILEKTYRFKRGEK